MSLRELFLFTNKEKRGLAVLLFLLSMSIAIPTWLGQVVLQKPEPVSPVPLIYSAPAAETGMADSPPAYFAFNPNELDSIGWLKLGFTPAQASTAMKYRRNGGYFRQRDDLLKLYFIDKETYLALRYFIRIDAERPSISSEATTSTAAIDINVATAEDWAALPGIGPVLSSRIVAYRNSLGGFDSIPQLLQVYGIKESWLAENSSRLQVKAPPDRTSSPATPAIVPIDINSADSAQLDALPGIGPYLSRQIVQYRNRLGGFIDTAQVREVPGIRQEHIVKVAPYVSIGLPPRQLSLSNASQGELAQHPYIGASLAAFIVSYRLRNGGFTSVEELLNSYQVDAARLERLRPYIVP